MTVGKKYKLRDIAELERRGFKLVFPDHLTFLFEPTVLENIVQEMFDKNKYTLNFKDHPLNIEIDTNTGCTLQILFEEVSLYKQEEFDV